MSAAQTMFEPMLIAWPSIRLQWDELLAEEARSDASAPSLYAAMEFLATELAGSFADGLQLEKAFDVIERWISDGPSDVREAVEIGLFERIKHAKGPKSSFKGFFRSRLKSQSRTAWDRV